MMTRESILQEIIEVATEALTSTKSVSDDLNLLTRFLYKKEVQLQADRLIEQIKEEESNYTPPKEDIRKLYVKRVPKTGLATRDNELIEIGSFRYGRLHRSKLNLPEGRRPNLCDVMRINATMNRYYPGWFYRDNEEVRRTLIDSCYQHIVVDNEYVVGITYGNYNFYYDDFMTA